jgi:hypothetical protein
VIEPELDVDDVTGCPRASSCASCGDATRLASGAHAKERNARVRHRSVVLAVLSVPVLAFVVALVWFIHGPLFWACLEALVLLFGAIGRPQGARLV